MQVTSTCCLASRRVGFAVPAPGVIRMIAEQELELPDWAAN